VKNKSKSRAKVNMSTDSRDQLALMQVADP